jgi:hypothetical protein
MKVQFKKINFRDATLSVIETSDEALDSYRSQGYRVTLRQLYYYFIRTDLFPSDWIDPVYNAEKGLPPDTKNTLKNYKRFGDLISDARLAGLLDWDMIEDRGRQPKKASEFSSLADLIDAAIASYRLPRWEGQDTYAELWVEKDALAGILEPLTREFHATLMVNKGYSSQSAMYEAAKRFIREADAGTGLRRRCVLFYLGDHDPSGMDMVRDIGSRLRLFGADVEVQKIGITMEQIRRFRCPPNPAKVTDPRAKDYIAQFGRQSWEVDAIPIPELNQLVRVAFKSIIDSKLMETFIAREELDKKKLLALAKRNSRSGR